MSNPIKTIVTFQSSNFNVSEPKEYFINAGCFGDDVAKWLIDRLRSKGLPAADANQEDFGWYFTFRIVAIEHCIVIGYRPQNGAEGTWIGWLERHRGFIASLLGARKRGIQNEAVQALHEVLASATEIRSLRWHFRSDFD